MKRMMFQQEFMHSLMTSINHTVRVLERARFTLEVNTHHEIDVEMLKSKSSGLSVQTSQRKTTEVQWFADVCEP